MIYYSKFQTEIVKKLEQGLERSLYGTLENFLREFILEKYQEQVFIISEQNSDNYQALEDGSRVGVPDITIKNRQDFPIGYLEVKLPKDSLASKKFDKQFGKYKQSLENLIFTNLKDWELWQWDEFGKAQKISSLTFDCTSFDQKNLEELQIWLQKFIYFTPRQSTSSRELAINLAKKTKLLESTLQDILLEPDSSTLKNIRSGLEKSILNSISDPEFCSLLAETLTYCLFIAGLECDNLNNLTLTTASDFIPQNIPLLQDLYQLVKNSTSKFRSLKMVLETIIAQIKHSDLATIKQTFLSSDSKKDPILYFYEDFLKECDSSKKKKRGVYYTPGQVVDFLVKATDDLIIKHFGLVDGLMDNSVKILGSATGTGTFLVSAIDLVKTKIENKMGGTGLETMEISRQLASHIQTSFFAFEFLISSYAVAHLKVSLYLQSLGYQSNERSQIYLTNTLNNPNEPIPPFTGFEHISDEGIMANTIKNDNSILAIIGNPPYSGSSQNPSKIGTTSTYIGNLMEDYKKDGFQKLAEKNPKWLQDDYAKFIRFAQDKIDKAKKGILAYIVPHGFIDNPTFRMMRKSLLVSFDQIYILDLHGNAKKKETAEDGSADENVFDIEQGVCLLIGVKLAVKNPQNLELATVRHFDLFGKRKTKFQFLEENNLESVKWQILKPQNEMYYFVPRNYETFSLYEKFWSVKDIFEVSGVGIVTAKDAVLIGFDKNRLKNQLIKSELKNDDTYDESCVKDINYRPFDIRKIYYDKKLVERARENVMKNMFQSNLALSLTRQVKASNWQHVFISNQISESCLVSSKTGEIGYIFPLYVYPENDGVFDTQEPNPKPNFTAEFTEFWQSHPIFQTKSELEIFGYIYGLLHSRSYRNQWNQFLKTDFPRIDFEQDFDKLSRLGNELISWHLMTNPKLEEPKNSGLKWWSSGDFVVANTGNKIWKNNQIWLSDATYLEGVDQSVWNFVIGGYQVLPKYLNSYKDESIDPVYFMKMVWSLKQSLEIMNQIDV